MVARLRVESHETQVVEVEQDGNPSLNGRRMAKMIITIKFDQIWGILFSDKLVSLLPPLDMMQVFV